jgi:hypothetical protein
MDLSTSSPNKNKRQVMLTHLLQADKDRAELIKWTDIIKLIKLAKLFLYHLIR